MYRYIFAAAAVAVATPAEAVFVEYEFTGQVQNDPNENIRFGFGLNERYDGPDAGFPVEVGDMLTLVFQAFLPVSFTPPPADGIYRFRIAGNSSGSVNPQTKVTFSGSLDDEGRPTFGPDPFGSFGYGLVYDSNPGVPDSERLSIDLRPGPGNVSDIQIRSTLGTTGYFYDPDTNAITAGERFDRGRCNDFDREGCSSLAVGEFSAILFGIPFLQADSSPQSPYFRAGFFGDINFAGGWNVPVITSASEVPEPSILLLFGAGAGALAWRRRKGVDRGAA